MAVKVRGTDYKMEMLMVHQEKDVGYMVDLELGLAPRPHRTNVLSLPRVVRHSAYQCQFS